MDDAITISNSCILPEGWTVDTLMEPHDSKALESALIDQPKVPKDQVDTLDDTLADKVIALLKEDP